MKISKVPPSEFAHLWELDPDVVYLNHGSFGACPRFILQKQVAYRQMLENQPVRFLVEQVEPLLDESRKKVAAFVNANPGDVVFVQNATTGVNTVFRSLNLKAGDEVLFTSHIYGACRQTLEFIRKQTGIHLVEAVYPFPVSGPEQIIDAVLSAVTPRTRILLIDHITSATALIHPVETIVKELTERGIDTMIDGAHALGSIPLDLEAIGAAYYTANCHKWVCSPKGAAILHVRKDRQKGITPVVISHAGYDAEPFTERFFWPGTWDPTPFLCAGDAVDYIGGLMPGGWPEVCNRNHRLCADARNLVCEILGFRQTVDDSMLASMATIPLEGMRVDVQPGYKQFDPLQEQLYHEHHIEIPVWNWSNPAMKLIRLSAQLYNSPEQYQYLAQTLKKLI